MVTFDGDQSLAIGEEVGEGGTEWDWEGKQGWAGTCSRTQGSEGKEPRKRARWKMQERGEG